MSEQPLGTVVSCPGLYFIGLLFLYSLSSSLLGGVGRDAEHIVDHIVIRGPAAARMSLAVIFRTRRARHRVLISVVECRYRSFPFDVFAGRKVTS